MNKVVLTLIVGQGIFAVAHALHMASWKTD